MVIDRSSKVSPGSSRMDEIYYDNISDFTRRSDFSARLPVHDDYFMSQEQFVKYTSSAYSHEGI